MMDAAHSDHLTGVYTDPDTFVRELGDHLAFAPTPEQLAEQVRTRCAPSWSTHIFSEPALRSI